MRKKGDVGVSGETSPTDAEVSIRLATFDQYRSLLFSIAYRMLGSVADAEDMLQETFIRWQQSAQEHSCETARPGQRRTRARQLSQW